jgi:hypothetical protein
VKLNASVLCHQFGDKSGVILYDTYSDVSVLLNCEECVILECNDGGVRVQLGDKVLEDLTRKGFLLGI